MKTVLLFLFALIVFLSCSTNHKKQSGNLEIEEIARFSLHKPVKFVVDSLQLKVDELTFEDEPPRILRSVIVRYNNKGTLEFFHERTSIISDNIDTKDQYLKKIAKKIINRVEWETFDGKKGSIEK